MSNGRPYLKGSPSLDPDNPLYSEAEMDALRTRLRVYAAKCGDLHEDYLHIAWAEETTVPARFEARIIELGLMASDDARALGPDPREER